MRPRLFLNHDADLGWLIALEFGITDDGQPSDRWAVLNEGFAYLTDDERCLGFVVRQFQDFDVHDAAHAPIWDEPFFDMPTLGLRNASAGEIVLAAHCLFDGQSSVNRHFFSAAIKSRRKPKKSVRYWTWCLQAGDVMAHYGLGYTLYDLGRFREAYQHLRAYTEITPYNPWPWCWLGKAADAIGEDRRGRAGVPSRP